MKLTEPKKIIHVFEAVEYVWDVLLAVILPTTLFAYAGRWLDKYNDSSPWFTLLGLVLALLVTRALVKKQIERYKKMTK